MGAVRARVVGVVAGGALALAPAVAGAAESVTSCGSVVSGAAVLADDLICTEGDGVVLLPGASLDLRGHSITGPANGLGTGILLPTGTTAPASVARGTVAGWRVGIGFVDDPEPSAPATLTRLVITGNSIGFSASSSPSTAAVAVDRSTFTSNRTALAARWNTVEVTSSRFLDNGTALVATEAVVRVDRSRIDRNGSAAYCDYSLCELTRSRLRDNASGVASAWGATVRLTDVLVSGSTTAVAAGSPQPSTVEVRDSLLRDNGTAIRLVNAASTVVGTTFRGNDVAYEGTVGEPVIVLPNLLQGNTFTRNGDGVLSVIPETQVGDNTAVRNTRWGIHAPGAVDLGGNTARRNGNEPQCVGVVCAPRS